MGTESVGLQFIILEEFGNFSKIRRLVVHPRQAADIEAHAGEVLTIPVERRWPRLVIASLIAGPTAPAVRCLAGLAARPASLGLTWPALD